MIFRKLPIGDTNILIQWAEDNNIEWEINNPEDVVCNAVTAELGLSQWPPSIKQILDDYEMAESI